MGAQGERGVQREMRTPACSAATLCSNLFDQSSILSFLSFSLIVKHVKIVLNDTGSVSLGHISIIIRLASGTAASHTKAVRCSCK